MTCPNCSSTHTVKNGFTRYNRQNTRCRACGRQFTQNRTNKIVTAQTRAIIDNLLLERLSLAGIA